MALRHHRQLEALDRSDHADALVGALGVVVGDPGIELGLGLLLVEAKTRPARNSARSGAVEALDLAGGGRAEGRRQQVAGCRAAADAVEEHLDALPAPKRPVKTLPLSVRICSGMPWRRAPPGAPHTPASRWRARPPAADTQKREWSSMPVTDGAGARR